MSALWLCSARHCSLVYGGYHEAVREPGDGCTMFAQKDLTKCVGFSDGAWSNLEEWFSYVNDNLNSFLTR